MSTFPESELPCPRLELRWEDQERDEDGYTVICHYNYVFPLRRLDIRAEKWVEDEDGERIECGGNREQVVRIGYTRTTKTADIRLRDDGTIETPFRDGSHIQWDRRYFGNAPMYAVAAGQAMHIDPQPTAEEDD